MYRVPLVSLVQLVLLEPREILEREGTKENQVKMDSRDNRDCRETRATEEPVEQMDYP